MGKNLILIFFKFVQELFTINLFFASLLRIKIILYYVYYKYIHLTHIYFFIYLCYVLKIYLFMFRGSYFLYVLCKGYILCSFPPFFPDCVVLNSGLLGL